MTKTVLTFGDSNTYGTPPARARGENSRYDVRTRWPMVMQAALGPKCTVIEEGLPGRTTCRPDPVMGAHMDGQVGLRIALESNGPIDLLIIMLGTNDCQMHHAATPEQITGGIASLLAIARSDPYQTCHDGFEIMLMAPPAVLEQGIYRETSLGAHHKSKALGPLIAALAHHWGVQFLNVADHISSSEIDGIHFDPADHVTLGNAVAAKIGTL